MSVQQHGAELIVSTGGFTPQWPLFSKVKAVRLGSTFTRDIRKQTCFQLSA